MVCLLFRSPYDGYSNIDELFGLAGDSVCRIVHLQYGSRLYRKSTSSQSRRESSRHPFFLSAIKSDTKKSRTKAPIIKEKLSLCSIYLYNTLLSIVEARTPCASSLHPSSSRPLPERVQHRSEEHHIARRICELHDSEPEAALSWMRQPQPIPF